MSDDSKQVDPEKLRSRILALAELIGELDSAGRLLDAVPRLLQQMGDLRALLFEYEVRCTGRLLPKSSEPPEVLEAQRIVEEAVRRFEEASADWSEGWTDTSDES